MRVCPRCGELKELTEFYKDKKSGYRYECKVCTKIRCSEYRKNNPDKIKEGKARWELNNPDKVFNMKQSGKGVKITYAEYEQMLIHQSSVCKICGGTNSSGVRLAVDHCHTTGKIRGLLCNKCNTAIGLIQDSALLAIKIAEYLLGAE